jgi:hypothetical protein
MDISQVLSDTLSSISADSTALRQLANLASHVGVTESDHVDEPVLGRLRNLDSAVSGLENKMKLLREIVNQEKNALDDLQSLSEESQRQNERLKVITHALEVQKENEALDSSPTERLPVDDDTSDYNLEAKLTRRSVAPNDRMDPHPAQSPAHHQIHLRRVARSDLQSLPRTVRGRISLSVVNDAVEEIEYVCRTKYTLLARNRRKQLQHTISQTTEEEPSDEPWVSEQELRQSCAFFRSGESTARAVLSILRSLNRLKQLPSKNGDIIYVCSTGMRERSPAFE